MTLTLPILNQIGKTPKQLVFISQLFYQKKCDVPTYFVGLVVTSLGAGSDSKKNRYSHTLDFLLFIF